MLTAILQFLGFHVGNAKRLTVIVRGNRLTQCGYAGDAEKKIYQLRLVGWMLPKDSYIEFDLEGPQDKLEKFLEHLKVIPMWARIDKIEVAWLDEKKNFHNFRTRH